MENKITITYIRNPFKPIESQEVKQIEALQPLSMREIVRHYYPAPLDTGFDVAVSVNGRILEKHEINNININPGDYVAFCTVPHGGGGGNKDIARAVAMLAIIVVTAVTQQYWLPALMKLGLSAEAATVVGFAIATTAGGIIVNTLLPPQLPDVDGFDFSNSQTYGWEPSENLYKENVALPILYGTHKITPPCIGRYVSTSGDKQYLNLLYAVAGHAINEITDIEINDTPIEYFTNVETEIRYGSTTQNEISYFHDTFSDTGIGVLLSTSWTTRQTQGNSVNAIGIGISLPQGLFYANDAGGLTEQSVTFQIDYRKVGNLSWTTHGTFTITEATNSAIRRYYLIENLESGQYEVRVKLTSELPTGARFRNATYWEYMQEIVADNFTYPGVSLLGLKILATDQLSGSTPRVTCIAKRNYVSVWTGSSYENKPATNPAWVCYDILHNEDCGDIPYSRIIYEKFAEWASFCTEKEYTCNIYFDVIMSIRKALDTISQLGRGSVIQAGSKFSCIFDSEDVPVQRFMFTMGNIIKDSFQETWLSTDERANVIEVSYYDAELDYTKQTVTIEQDDFDSQTEIRTNQIDLIGCTDRDTAIKHGKYLMNCNRYLTNTVSFDADVDAIACLPGDVIEVAHDVPQWGYSGRIVSATSNTVTLDREVTLSPGTTYAITIQHYETDERETKYIESVEKETTTDTLTLTSSWTTTPSKFALYSFGQVNMETKLFRVISITRANDMRRKITALEYYPDVYDDEVEIPEFTNISDLDPVIGFSATENLKFGADGTVKNIVSLTWRGTAIKWYVYISSTSDTGPWTLLGIAYNPFYEVENLIPGKTYYFTVNNKPNPYEYTPVAIEYTGQAYTPTAPSNLSASLSGQFIVLDWTANEDVVTAGYNIYLNNELLAYNYTSNKYIYKANLTAGTYNFKVTALNSNLEESDYSETASVNISVPATPSPSQSISGEIVTISWSNCQTSLPIAYYTVNGVNIGNVLRHQVRITWTGTETFYVKAYDIAGNESGTGSVAVTITAVPTPTSLTATGSVHQITLTTTVTIPEGGVLEVWSATVNNRANAVKLADATSTTFVHTGLSLIDTRYYWVRVRDKYGTTGSWYPSSATNGVVGQTSQDPSDYLAILEDSITSDQLATELSSRIDILDKDYIYESGVYETDPVMVFGGLDAIVNETFSRAVTNTGLINNLSTATSTLQDAISSIQTDISDINLTIDLHTENIDDLLLETSSHATAIASLQAEIVSLTTEEWSDSQEYTVGRYVVHDGKVYRCIQGYTPPPAYEPGEEGSEEYWEDAQAIVTLINEVSDRVDVLEGVIETKVSQTDFDLLSGTVSTHTSQITQLGTEISQKVSQTTFDTLANTVSTHTSEISQLDSEIDLKVSQSDFNAFSTLFLPEFNSSNTYPENYMVRYNGLVYKCITEIDFTPAPLPTNTNYWEQVEFAETFSTALSEIKVNSDTIELYSGAITGPITYLFDDENRVYETDIYVETAADVRNIDTRISQAGIEIDGINSTLTLYANYIDGLEDRVSQAEIDIDGLNAEIVLKASQADFDDLEDRVSDAEIVIDGHTSTISLHTSQISSLQSADNSLDSRLDSAEIRITQAEIDIDGLNAEIVLKASQADLDGLEDRVSDAEIVIDGHTSTISLHTSQISSLQSADNSLDSRLDTAETTINSHSSTLSSLDSRLSSAETTISTHTSQISALQTETGSLDNRLDTAETTINSHSSTLSSHGSRLSSAETTINSHTSSISIHETRISSAESAIIAGQAGTWASISSKLATATYDSDQKDANGYLRAAALENRFLVYDTQNAPDWNSSTTYYPGTIVKSGSSYYRCIKQSTNNQPPNATYWTVITAGLVSQWTLKLNAKGRVAGIGAMLDSSAGSEIVMLADKFKIMRPDETGTPVQIFTAGTINGVNSVGISGNLIIDGSILARNIGTNEVIANTANIKDSIITGAKIKDATITTAKIQDAAITNAKIASLDASKITSGYISADRIAAGSITASKLNVSSLSAITANLGTITAGLAQNAAGTNYINFNATGTSSFLKVGSNVDIKADGSGYFARSVVSEPDIVAYGTYSCDSGWSGSWTNKDEFGNPTWVCYIDTGVTFPEAWNEATSTMYKASATIAGGYSKSWGCRGYTRVEVVYGDGLCNDSFPWKTRDNGVYIRFQYSNVEGGYGGLQITSIKWKLVRV